MRAITLIFCLFVLSCTEDKTETNVFAGEITAIESLTNITLGNSDTITVTFRGGTDGCAKPDHLEAAFAGNIVTFKAFYNYPAHPAICPLNIPVHRLKYVFKPASKGSYTYKSFDNDVTATTQVN